MKVEYKSMCMAVVVGVLSGIVAYASYGPVRQFGFSDGMPIFIYFILYPGTVFGIISGLYYFYITNATRRVKLLRLGFWVVGSFASFSIAVLSLFFTEYYDGMLIAGLLGATILLVSFAIPLRQMHVREYAVLLTLGACIPAILSAGLLGDIFMRRLWNLSGWCCLCCGKQRWLLFFRGSLWVKNSVKNTIFLSSCILTPLIPQLHHVNRISRS
jgi:hypothetical protein